MLAASSLTGGLRYNYLTSLLPTIKAGHPAIAVLLPEGFPIKKQGPLHAVLIYKVLDMGDQAIAYAYENRLRYGPDYTTKIRPFCALFDFRDSREDFYFEEQEPGIVTEYLDYEYSRRTKLQTNQV